MTKKSLIALWIVALILASAVFITRFSQPDTSPPLTDRKSGDKVFAKFDAKSVQALTIKSDKNTTTVNLKNHQWVVSERSQYPASLQKIYRILRSLSDLKIIQSLSASTQYNERFGLDAKNSVQLEFKNAQGKIIHKLTLGRETESHGRRGVNRYVRSNESPTDVYIVDGSFAAIDAMAASWLKKDFFEIDNLQSIKTPKWKISRENIESDFGDSNRFVLKSNLKSQIEGLFTSAHFSDVVNNPNSVKDGNLVSFTLSTFDGFKYLITYQGIKDDTQNALFTMKVSANILADRPIKEGETEEQKKAADIQFATNKKRLEDKLKAEKAFEGITYILSKSQFEPLLKTKDEVLEKKITEKTTKPSAESELPADAAIKP